MSGDAGTVVMDLSSTCPRCSTHGKPGCGMRSLIGQRKPAVFPAEAFGVRC